MGTIVSKRGRDLKAKADHRRRLEEKYLIDKLPLSADEQEHIRRVFDGIRRQLDIMGQSAGKQHA